MHSDKGFDGQHKRYLLGDDVEVLVGDAVEKEHPAVQADELRVAALQGGTICFKSPDQAGTRQERHIG